MPVKEPLNAVVPAPQRDIKPSTEPAKKPLKIALLSYRSAPFVGGQGIYIHYLSRALHSLGHQVDVISGPPYPKLDDTIRLIKLPSLDLFEEKNHVTALKLKHCLSYTDFYEWFTMLTGGFGEPYTFGRRALKYLKKFGLDYDIIHDNQSLSYSLLALEKQGFPIVTTIHHPITRDYELALAAAPNKKHRLLVKRWYSFLKMQKRVAQKLKYVTTVSMASQIDIEKYFLRVENQTQLIPNGIDTSIFRPLDKTKKNPWQIITTASADQPIKGLSYLLEAIANLKQEFPELSLLVVGKLKKGSATAKTLEKMRLNKHVKFVSGISTQRLVEHYNQSSIAICPSLYEGFGLPAAEAMSCGLPVITSDGGALPEVVGDAGKIVPKGNSLALSKAIKELILDREQAQQLAKISRQHVLDNFCWQRVAEKLTMYYQTIINSRDGNGWTNGND